MAQSQGVTVQEVVSGGVGLAFVVFPQIINSFLHSVSILVAHCAYQHHERLDGSGYPRGITEEDIHPFAECDLFKEGCPPRLYSRMITCRLADCSLEEPVDFKSPGNLSNAGCQPEVPQIQPDNRQYACHCFIVT